MSLPCILVALIHNQSEHRLTAVRPEVDKVVKTLRGRFAPQTVEIAWQPSSLPVNALRELLARALLLRYEIAFRFYVARVTSKLSLKNMALLAAKSFAKFLGTFRGRSTFVTEQFLTEKHLRAWQYAADKDNAFCLVVEDDVRVLDYSGLNSVWKFLSGVRSHESVGVFLSTPFRVRESGVRFEVNPRNGFGHLLYPAVSNSSAAYALSPALLKDMMAVLTDRPWLRLLPADLMINEVFKNIQSQQVLEVYHVQSQLIQNGSLSGATPSLLKHSYL